MSSFQNGEMGLENNNREGGGLKVKSMAEMFSHVELLKF